MGRLSFLFALGAFVLSFTGVAIAQSERVQCMDQCNAVLAVTSAVSTTVTNDLRTDIQRGFERLCSEDEGKIKAEASRDYCGKSSKTSSSGVGLNAVIKNIPLGLNFDSDSERKNKFCDDSSTFQLNEWRKHACSTSSSERLALERGQAFAQNADSRATLEVWQQCVQACSNTPELICSGINSQDLALLSISWNAEGLGELSDISTEVINLELAEFPGSLNGSVMISASKIDPTRDASFILHATNPKDVTCHVPLTAKCKNPQYHSRASKACPIDEYNSGKSVNCGGSFEWREATSEACGVLKYKVQSSQACEPLYKSGSGSVCGACQRWKQGHTSACGRKWDGSRKRCRHKNNGCEIYPTCRHSSFGRATDSKGEPAWKSCEDKSHGVADHKTCRHESHGPDITTLSSCPDPEYGIKSHKVCEDESHGLRSCLDKSTHEGGLKPTKVNWTKKNAPPPPVEPKAGCSVARTPGNSPHALAALFVLGLVVAFTRRRHLG